MCPSITEAEKSLASTKGKGSKKPIMTYFKTCKLKLWERPLHFPDLNIIENLGVDLIMPCRQGGPKRDLSETEKFFKKQKDIC